MKKITILIFILIIFSKALLANKVDFIIVNKEDRNIILFNNGKELKKFSISLVFEPLGTKIKKVDGKTHEG